MRKINTYDSNISVTIKDKPVQKVATGILESAKKSNDDESMYSIINLAAQITASNQRREERMQNNGSISIQEEHANASYLRALPTSSLDKPSTAIPQSGERLLYKDKVKLVDLNL